MDVFLIVMLGLGLVVTVTYVIAMLRLEKRRKEHKASDIRRAGRDED
jgi:hypothetical protein